MFLHWAGVAIVAMLLGMAYIWWMHTFVDVHPVPKIIHQLAPKDSSSWPDVWHKCQATWKTLYPNYEYILWTDEMMDTFMKTEFPEYYEMYSGYKRHIHRVDAVRYFILYRYGGIYADMDVEVLKDFASYAHDCKVHLIESPYKWNEECQNSLMISPKAHPFWPHVFKELRRSSERYFGILDVAGPRMLDRAMKSWWLAPYYLRTLPYIYFNPDKDTLSEVSRDDLYTIHYGTCAYLGDMQSTQRNDDRVVVNTDGS